MINAKKIMPTYPILLWTPAWTLSEKFHRVGRATAGGSKTNKRKKDSYLELWKIQAAAQNTEQEACLFPHDGEEDGTWISSERAVGEMEGNEINAAETIGRIYNPAETTLKCQWLIDEHAQDGNMSIQEVMSDNWNSLTSKGIFRIRHRGLIMIEYQVRLMWGLTDSAPMQPRGFSLSGLSAQVL